MDHEGKQQVVESERIENVLPLLSVLPPLLEVQREHVESAIHHAILPKQQTIKHVQRLVDY